MQLGRLFLPSQASPDTPLAPCRHTFFASSCLLRGCCRVPSRRCSRTAPLGTELGLAHLHKTPEQIQTHTEHTPTTCSLLMALKTRSTRGGGSRCQDRGPQMPRRAEIEIPFSTTTEGTYRPAHRPARSTSGVVYRCFQKFSGWQKRGGLGGTHTTPAEGGRGLMMRRERCTLQHGHHTKEAGYRAGEVLRKSTRGRYNYT